MNFLTKLHSESSLSRKLIDEIYKMIQFDIVQPILNMIDDEKRRESVTISFENLNSFYKFKKKLKEQGKLTHAEQRIVAEKTGLAFKNGTPRYETITERISLMPIHQQIKLFFELPNVLDTTLDYMRQLEQENEQIENFVQGDLWKRIKQNFNHEDIVIPCFLYHDDFGADNPLSSNAENSKIAAFYYSFPVIPQHLLSSPNYIFDALFFRSSLKNEELSLLLDPLIEVFKELEEEGIILNINGKETRIYVVLSLIIGDNLALNELIGMTKSFNSRNFCRFCITPKDFTNHDTTIRNENIRTMSNYEDHVNKKMYGWKETCQFVKLKNFHPILNYSCDIMHDIFEGVARYDIAMILNYIIYEKKIITLGAMNKLKQEFEYGAIEIGNLGPELLEHQIKGGQITMSASEMKTFIHFLPLMIGDRLSDKKYVKVWELLTLLIQIIDLVLQTSLSNRDIVKIKFSISSYLQNRQKNFPQSNLKPKHHFLLHYYDCITKSGPLRSMMTFSYEQRNRIVKKYSKATHQRVNLACSLAYKCAMKFNSFLDQHKNGFPDLYFYEKEMLLNYDDLKSKNYYTTSIFDDSWNSLELVSLSWIKYKSTLFKIGFNVAIRSNEIECYEIIDILGRNGNFYLILEKVEIIEYSKHMMCYFVGKLLKEYKLHELKEMEFFPFNMHQTYHGKTAFRLKKV